MTDPIDNQTQNTNTPPAGDPGFQGGTPTPPPVPPTPPTHQGNGGVSDTSPQAHTEPPTAVDDYWGDLTSGNAVLDGTIKAFTKSAGMSPADFMQIVGNAIDYSDPELIDTTLLNTKYSQHAGVIKELTNALIGSVNESRNAAQNVAYSVAGSKEAWEQSVAVFNANAPDYLKSAIKAMIDNGNIQEGAQMLMQSVGQYGSSGTNMPRFTGSNTHERGLSFDELKSELGKLVKEAGGASLESGTYGRRYEDLMRRRAIGRQQGI